MKVAVIVPVGHVRGGVRRAALSITSFLVAGRDEHGEPIRVVLAVGGDVEDWGRGLDRRARDRVDLRQVRFDRVGSGTAELAMAAVRRPMPVDAAGEEWAMIRDGASDLLDCDVWMSITTRSAVGGAVLALLPLRPTVMIPFDFLEAYGYTGMRPSDIRESLRAARAADSVLVSTQQAHADAVGLAGCRADRVVMTPVEFTTSALPTLPAQGDVAGSPICLWISNGSPHKNHERTLDALDAVAARVPDFRCVATGHRMRSRIAAVGGRERRPYLDVRDYVPDGELVRLLARSRFLLHSVLLDNGSYTPLEAASAGIATVCSDYPPMREIAEMFGLRCCWFDPWDTDDIARAVVAGWTDPSEWVGQQTVVAHLTWERVSRDWLAVVTPLLERHVAA